LIDDMVHVYIRVLRRKVFYVGTRDDKVSGLVLLEERHSHTMGGSIRILGGCHHCIDFIVDGPFEGLLLLLLDSIKTIIHNEWKETSTGMPWSNCFS